MGRKPLDKPWLHNSTGYWCITFDGKREYLDRDYQVACRKLKALKARRKREQAGGREWLDQPFSVLADEYMADIKARKKPATYRAVRYSLLRALKILGSTLRVGEMRKLHLRKIEQALQPPDYSPTTLKHTIAAVQAVFYWAVDLELLDSTPFVKYKKPKAHRRSRVITPEEYEKLLAKADPHFGRVITALRMTGCRPGEIRTLIWEWVDLESKVWIIPGHKTVTQQTDPQPRIIPLPEKIVEMCKELAQQPQKPQDRVFLNKFGRPYTKDCFVRKMDRLRKRAGIEAKAGEQVVLYSNRHTYGTEKSARVSSIELAELMGHTDVRTTLLAAARHWTTSPAR
jgi:integrase